MTKCFYDQPYTIHLCMNQEEKNTEKNKLYIIED